jgi:hypothetical protein
MVLEYANANPQLNITLHSFRSAFDLHVRFLGPIGGDVHCNSSKTLSLHTFSISGGEYHRRVMGDRW